MLEGKPDVWIDGDLHALVQGDGVAFPAGTGIAHCFLNNTDAVVRLLIIGERHADDRVAYPVNLELRHEPNYWHDAPARPLGRTMGDPVDRGAPTTRPGVISAWPKGVSKQAG